MMTKKISRQKPADQNETIREAHVQAERDIEKDPDLSKKPEAADDLDEGELARLEAED